jgi:hypothetical protein
MLALLLLIGVVALLAVVGIVSVVGLFVRLVVALVLLPFRIVGWVLYAPFLLVKAVVR